VARRPSIDSGALKPSSDIDTLKNTFPAISGPPSSRRSRRRRPPGCERSGLHIEYGEADADLWCCATALEPGPDGEILALTVVAMGEPAARERAGICRAMRRESQNVGFSLSPAG
jgi:hypothetical protein